MAVTQADLSGHAFYRAKKGSDKPHNPQRPPQPKPEGKVKGNAIA